MQVRKQQLEPEMEKQTGSKGGKEFIKAVYCHPAYLTSMQSTSCEVQDLVNHKLESRFPREISTTSDTHDITLMAESEEELKSLLMVKEEGGKHWFKTQHSKIEDHGIQSHHFMANRWGQNENSDRLYFLGLQNHYGW